VSPDFPDARGDAGTSGSYWGFAPAPSTRLRIRPSQQGVIGGARVCKRQQVSYAPLESRNVLPESLHVTATMIDCQGGTRAGACSTLF